MILTQIEHEIRQALFKKAQEGDLEALALSKELYNVKIYTNEEISLVNRIRGGLLKMAAGEKIDVSDQERVLDLPDYNGDLHPAALNWLQRLEEGEPYYKANLKYLGHGDYTEWILKLDSETGFKPLFCAHTWSDESTRIAQLAEARSMEKKEVKDEEANTA